jgi:glycosyltransferase involved in cell wall biosynthesis
MLCVGNLEREQGGHRAVWTCAILSSLIPHGELVMVGTGSQQPALQTLAEGLHVGRHVRFLGPQAELAEVFAQADTVWIPSLANCGRQVALDAMAHSRAVIASDVPCLREVIADGETGFLVPPGEVVAFAQRTRSLFQDSELRRRLGDAARRHVQMRFSVGAAVQRWHEVYRRVAA